MSEKTKEEAKSDIRRRGHHLEAAIYQAVWEELAAVGFPRLTMESVAARANTSKPVLYRRYANKTELVLGAIQSRIPTPEDEIPNTGELRQDLLEALANMNRNVERFGSDTIRCLLVELDNRPLSATLFPKGRSSHTMKTILGRAEARGELSMDRISTRIMAMPVDLMRHEIFLSSETVSPETIREIIDELFLPLLRTVGLKG
ncbi:TetR/AcrR family transcriptional regulator [Paenibacillus sp. HW567]|uniref:TetR/AcrR family transcriptional regulator n=1 Tax=Paenibacillus sp. HW567 TaxID=1034769 RepID=UPI0003664AA2|nr:TetR/AcrR family transcriptional regulator [Paenibacillus sp. HW567]